MRRKWNLGLALLLVAVFLAASPVPFLNDVGERPGETPLLDRVLRLGQSFAMAQFTDAGPITWDTEKVYEVDVVRFLILVDKHATHDELDAIFGSAISQQTIAKYRDLKRVRFNGWRPSFLPVRIPYRYITLVSLALGLIGLYLLLARRPSVLTEPSGQVAFADPAPSVKPRSELARSLAILTWSLAAMCGAFYAFVMLALNKVSNPPDVVSSLLVSTTILAGALFYVYLGVLAARLERSVLVWVGLTFITKPIGPIVAYFRMRRLVQNALARRPQDASG